MKFTWHDCDLCAFILSAVYRGSILYSKGIKLQPKYKETSNAVRTMHLIKRDLYSVDIIQETNGQSQQRGLG